MDNNNPATVLAGLALERFDASNRRSFNSFENNTVAGILISLQVEQERDRRYSGWYYEPIILIACPSVSRDAGDQQDGNCWQLQLCRFGMS